MPDDKIASFLSRAMGDAPVEEVSPEADAELKKLEDKLEGVESETAEDKDPGELAKEEVADEDDSHIRVGCLPTFSIR